ncbi:MAG: hypothetical protein JO069_03440 [Verrucomicrobia bacterium]|nr:hypothetical protein [Verrucomicrobiota bacterium]
MEILERHYFHTTVAAVRAWEDGERSPRGHTARVLERFLEDHPNVSLPEGQPPPAAKS